MLRHLAILSALGCFVAVAAAGTSSGAPGCPTSPNQAGAQLAGANLDHCNLSDLTRANVSGSNTTHTTCQNTNTFELVGTLRCPGQSNYDDGGGVSGGSGDL